MSKQDINQLLYGLEQLKTQFKEFQRKINEQISRINSIIYSGNNYDEDGNPIPNPILSATQINIVLANGNTEILLQYGSDQQNNDWYQSLTYENEYVQVVNGVVVSRFDSRRNIYTDFDYRMYNNIGVEYPTINNLYNYSGNLITQELTLQGAKYIIDNIPLWDSTGVQKWTKEELYREVIDAYTNLPYLNSEINTKNITTKASQNNYLFSNKNCRNVYLSIKSDNTNKIYIEPGELYENLNLELKGNFYINGAQNITMRLDATEGCVMLNHAKNITIPNDSMKPIGFFYVAENTVVDGHLLITGLKKNTNIIIEDGGFNKSHGVIDCEDCEEIYIGYNCIQNSIVRRVKCQKLILQNYISTPGALCNCVVDINRPNYVVVLSSGCCNNGECDLNYPIFSTIDTLNNREFIYFKNLYNYSETYAQSLSIQQGYDKSVFLRKQFKNIEIVGTTHNADIIEQYKNNGPFDYYWVQYDLRLKQIACIQDQENTTKYTYYGNLLKSITTQTFEQWGPIQGLEQQQSYIVLQHNDINVQMFGNYNEQTNAFTFQFSSGQTIDDNFTVASIYLFLGNQNYNIQTFNIENKGSIMDNFSYTSVNINFNRTQDFFVQLNENVTTLNFSGVQENDSNLFDFDLGGGDKNILANINIDDKQIQKMGKHDAMFYNAVNYNCQQFVKNMKIIGERCFYGAKVQFNQQVVNLVCTDIYGSAFEQIQIVPNEETQINTVILQKVDKSGNVQQIQVHGSQIFANIDNYGVSVDMKLDLSRASTDISISNAFVNNKVLNNIVLYSSTFFEEIGAFVNSSVKNVTVAQKLSGYSVGGQMFKNCQQLSSFDFVNAATLGESQFENCVGLVNISGNSVIVPNRCFYNCSKLKSVMFTSLSSVGVNAFRKCVSLSSCYTQQISSFGQGCFAETSLASMIVQNFPTVSNILGDSVLANNNVVTNIEYYPETYNRGFEYARANVKCYNINAYNKLVSIINSSSGNIYTNVRVTYQKQ